MFLHLLKVSAPLFIWLLAALIFSRVRKHKFPLQAFFYAAVALWSGFALVYLLIPTFSDLVEVSIASSALAKMNGQPLYHPLDANVFFTLLYGPLTYGLNIFSFNLFGMGYSGAKLTGVVSTGLALFFSYLTYRRTLAKDGAKFLVACLALLSLSFGHYAFSNRSEGPLLLLLALALYSYQSKKYFPVMLGVSTAFAFLLKASSIIYFLPILSILASFRSFVLCAVTGITIFIISYVILPVEWESYWLVLQEAGQHPLTWAYFGWTVPWLFLLGTLFFAPGIKQDRRTYLSLLVATAMILITASKIGSGKHHILPLSLSIFFFIARSKGFRDFESYTNRISVRATVIILLTFSIYSPLEALKPFMGSFDFALAKAEMTEMMKDHPDKKWGVAFSRTKEFYFLKLVPQLHKHPNFIDDAALNDRWYAGGVEPEAVRDAIENCPYDFVFVAKGESPWDKDKIVSLDFIRKVELYYHPASEMSQRSNLFDIWSCQKEAKI